MVSFGVGHEAGTRLRRAGWLLHAGAVGRRLRALEYTVKSSFDPNQPRVPAGNPDGGQWTDGGGGGGSNAGQSERIRLAQNEPRDHRTDIPKEKPASGRLRNIALKIVAREVSQILRAREELRGSIGHVLTLLGIPLWVHEFVYLVQSYADQPKTLEELQRAVSTPALGFQIHHIVEQGPAARDKFPRAQIHAPENLVLIPTLKHYSITGWFGKPNKNYGGRLPRDHLRGKDWSERTRVGLDALIEHGVLKP